MKINHLVWEEVPPAAGFRGQKWYRSHAGKNFYYVISEHAFIDFKYFCSFQEACTDGWLFSKIISFSSLDGGSMENAKAACQAHFEEFVKQFLEE